MKTKKKYKIDNLVIVKTYWGKIKTTYLGNGVWQDILEHRFDSFSVLSTKDIKRPYSYFCDGKSDIFNRPLYSEDQLSRREQRLFYKEYRPLRFAITDSKKKIITHETLIKLLTKENGLEVKK